jgi:hypothetical protein
MRWIKSLEKLLLLLLLLLLLNYEEDDDEDDGHNDVNEVRVAYLGT